MTAPLDLLVAARRVVLPDGERACAVGVSDARIVWIGAADAAPPARQRLDLAHQVLLPGMVDSHVHVNDPGTEWEGFSCAGRAAAAGGVTTIIDMPLNSRPVTTDLPALHAKVAAAAGRTAVDYAFWAGIVPGNTERIATLAAAPGVRGFKCFLCPSGLDEFPAVSSEDLDAAMPQVARTGLPLLVHAEDPDILRTAAASARGARTSYARHLASRPATAEVRAIEMLAELARRHGCRVHVVHVSSAEAVAAVVVARSADTPISAETCPHYLTFAAEEIDDGRCEFKCAPPIRDSTHRTALWTALAAGHLDLVASDHSPCLPSMRCLGDGDLGAAWGGVASLQVTLAAVWSGLRGRGGDLLTLSRWMAGRPATLAGLGGVKGTIEVGCDADLVVFDADAEFVVDAAKLEHRHPVTPYAGLRLTGVVERTFVRGIEVYHDGEFSQPAIGQPVIPR